MTSIACTECKQSIVGEALVRGPNIFHVRCERKADLRAQGFPFECPVCHGNPRVYHEASIHDHTKDPGFGFNGEGGPGDSRSYKSFSEAHWVACEQCHGRGYVKVEPKQIPTGMKWVTE